jgi:hypothetical protein
MSAEQPYRAHVDALLKHWNELTVFPPAREPKGPWVKHDPIPQHAFLLFSRWAENLVAQALEQALPKWARDRVTVPDGRNDYAPFLLELPEELILAAPTRESEALCDWLAQCLETTAQQVRQRTIAQDFCGVVLSAAPARTIVRHWVALGAQHRPYQPDADELAVFRYHDARVMQRMWPALRPAQQRQWLGPVTHWWSLQQPWGSFNKDELVKPVPWFHAKAPVRAEHDEQSETQRVGLPADLFDTDQWVLASLSPRANAIWRSYAENGVAPATQPDVHTLMQMLADAARFEFKGDDLENYVWTTWQHSPEEGPPHAMDWSLPHTAPVLARIQGAMQKTPDTSFLRELNMFVQVTE